MTVRGLALLLLLLAAGTASAEEGVAVVDEAALGASVARSLSGYIEPSLERFRESADTLAAETQALCGAPSPARLETARDAFRGAVLAWARIGFLGLAPFVEENRAERVQFWPDPRGVSERQMRALLRAQDERATDPATLKTKSVAVQGLPALERLLHGGAGDALATERPGSFPCRYAAAAAKALAEVAGELEASFAPDAPFPRLMTAPGPDNALYLSGAEAAEDLVNAAAAAIGEARDGVLEAALGDRPEDAKPKSAPFWRSDLALPFLVERLSGVQHMIEIGGFSDALPETKRWIVGSLILEFETAAKALSEVRLPLLEAVADDEDRQALRRAIIATLGLRTLLSETLPEGLGIEIGFNAADGD